jgi:hypothetical protein
VFDSARQVPLQLVDHQGPLVPTTPNFNDDEPDAQNAIGAQGTEYSAGRCDGSM